MAAGLFGAAIGAFKREEPGYMLGHAGFFETDMGGESRLLAESLS